MPINNFWTRQQPPPARLRPAPLTSWVPELSLDSTPELSPASPPASLAGSSADLPSDTPPETPPSTPDKDGKEQFDMTPAQRPTYGVVPARLESDTDLLEVPPAAINRFVVAIPDRAWPHDREGQENTVDMVASLSANPHCQHFRHLRVEGIFPFFPTYVHWPEVWYDVWLASSDQARRRVHQVAIVLFENGATTLWLKPEEVSDGGSRPWTDDWKRHHLWAPRYGLWTRET
ncbi:hypothetical protein MBLNU457_g2669t1 [Dothideomycetes sp. NU457]